MTDRTQIAAGPFLKWLEETNAGLEADVPCGDCNACCRSAYFIHVRAEDAAAREVIPKLLLFPAPGQSADDQIMGYGNQNQCPMLIEHACSIYPSRPKTCKDYDCRVFAATNTLAGGKEKEAVNARVERWEFSFSTPQDRRAYSAVQEAVSFLKHHAEHFVEPPIPDNPTQFALLALSVFDLFLLEASASESDLATASTEAKLAAIRARLNANG